MNAFLPLGLLLLAAGPKSQAVHLGSLPVSEQKTRAPAVDTTVAVYDVNDVVDKMTPRDAAREDLKRKLDAYVDDREKAREDTSPGAAKDGSDAAAKKVADARLATTQDLAALVQRYMKPAFEPEHQQLDVPSAGVIVGNLVQEQHAWLAAFLDVQRRASGVGEIAIEILQAPRGTFREMGLKDPSTVVEDPARLSAVRTELNANKNVERLSAPRIAAGNGMKASMAVLDQVVYVKDWKLTIVEPGPKEIPLPTVDVVQDGYAIEMRATALDPHAYGLDLGFKVQKLERPIPTRKVRLSATSNEELEIGVPVVSKISFDSNLVLAEGASALFTTAAPVPDKDMLIIVTLTHRSL